MFYQLVCIIIVFAPAVQHIVYLSTSNFFGPISENSEIFKLFLDRIVLETIWKNKTILLHAGESLRFDRNKCKNRENGNHFTCKALRVL